MNGYIFVLFNYSMLGLLKIGMTERDVESRVKELSLATGVTTPFICLYSEKFNNCRKAEREILNEDLEYAELEKKQQKEKDIIEKLEKKKQKSLSIAQDIRVPINKRIEKYEESIMNIVIYLFLKYAIF